jgi:hypothetical protein
LLWAHPAEAGIRTRLSIVQAHAPEAMSNEKTALPSWFTISLKNI